MFSKFLGDRPERLGIVASLYDQYTASYLTSQLMNIYARDKKNRDQYQSINSFMVEWDVNVNFIKRVPFLIAPIGDGANGTDGKSAYEQAVEYIELNKQLIEPEKPDKKKKSA